MAAAEEEYKENLVAKTIVLNDSKKTRLYL